MDNGLGDVSQEIVSLDGSGQLPPLERHDKSNDRKITNSCMPHAPMCLRDYPKVTLLGGPLSHTRLHRGNCVPELHAGSRQLFTHEHLYKMFNATDFDPGDIKTELDSTDENEAIYDELVHHCVQRGLKDPEGYFDLADEEIQTILNQGREGKGTDDVRDVGTVKLNVFEHSSDSESIEVLSGHENSEDEEFLGYYTVGPDGKKRPIPAPRRLVRIPAANGSEADASSPVTQDSSSTPQSVEPKNGKEVVFAEVRRHRISLSDDSQGRDLTLIPPGYDGHSMLNTLRTKRRSRNQGVTCLTRFRNIKAQKKPGTALVQSFNETKHASAPMATASMLELSCQIM